jgi:hypothetical protein
MGPISIVHARMLRAALASCTSRFLFLRMRIGIRSVAHPLDHMSINIPIAPMTMGDDTEDVSYILDEEESRQGTACCSCTIFLAAVSDVYDDVFRVFRSILK